MKSCAMALTNLAQEKAGAKDPLSAFHFIH
jgi:hypothetical protein